MTKTTTTTRQGHRQSARNTICYIYFWNPDDALIPNMMIDTSPWSSCSRRSPWSTWSPWLPCSSSSHTFSSTGQSVSPDFFKSLCQILFLNYYMCTSIKIYSHEMRIKQFEKKIAASNVKIPFEIFCLSCISVIWLDVPTGHTARVPSLILGKVGGKNCQFLWTSRSSKFLQCFSIILYPQNVL